MSEKRADTRFNITFCCQFNTINQAFSAYTENLSLGGALVHLKENKQQRGNSSASYEIHEGDIAKCHFDIDDLRFDIASEVKRVMPASVALEFTKLTPEQIYKLHTFINAHAQ